jgi:hypothetical protein
MTRRSTAERQEYLQQLRDMLKPGDTLYTVLRHVSRSGMSRRIDVYAIRDNRPVWLSGRAAVVIGWSIDLDKSGIRVAGCGMDMGFHLVDTISAELFRDLPDYYKSSALHLRHEWL